MNEQISWIAGLLDAHGIPYCVDSGTLLGLMREGDTIAHDSDIDISIWGRYEPKIRNLLHMVRECGYRIKVYMYRNSIYSYTFHPPARSNLLKIDINLFREHGDHAWCPVLFAYNPYRPGTFRYYGYLLVRYNLFGVVMLLGRWSTVNRLDSWPWRLLFEAGTWWIPRSYFDNVVRVRQLGVLVPRDWKGYLEFRYGDWKNRPKRRENDEIDWYFPRDDRGLQRKPPEEMTSYTVNS